MSECIAATRQIFEAYQRITRDPSAVNIAARVEARTPSRSESGGVIAVLPVFGFIEQRQSVYGRIFGSTATDALSARFRQAMADSAVKAIVLQFDSGGGSTFGVSELASVIRSARAKPVVAQIDAVACSAAFWIASACDEVISTPSGICGSIGVYATHVDTTGADEKAGVRVEVLAAPSEKANAVPGAKLSDEGRASLQEVVSTTYRRFVADVAAGRGCSTANVEARYGRGNIMTATAAKVCGLVDTVATMDETLQRLASERGRESVYQAQRYRATFSADGGEAQRRLIIARATVPSLHLVPAKTDGEEQRRRIRERAGL